MKDQSHYCANLYLNHTNIITLIFLVLSISSNFLNASIPPVHDTKSVQNAHF